MLDLIYGTDSYRIREALDTVVAHHHAKHANQLEIVQIDCNDASARETLERNLKYPSFFGEMRLLVVSNAASESLGEILDTYDFAKLPDIVMIALQDTSVKGFDKKILTKLEKRADTVSVCMPLEGDTLRAWMQSYCARANATLNTEVASLLVRTVGNDTRTIANELDKLMAYAQGEPLNATMVQLLIPPRQERDEWELSNAIASHDKRAVVTALWRKLQEGNAEHMLLGSLAAGLRNLIMIKDLSTRQHIAASIAKTTGLHPFVISKSLSGARSADASRLTQAHIALALLDRGSKDGRMDITDSLFAVLLAL